MYDFNSRKMITSLDGSDFLFDKRRDYSHTTLNFGHFDNKEGKYILTGGSGGENESLNRAKVFDITSKEFISFYSKDGAFSCGDFS